MLPQIGDEVMITATPKIKYKESGSTGGGGGFVIDRSPPVSATLFFDRYSRILLPSWQQNMFKTAM